MLRFMYILTCICTVAVDGSRWATPEEEKADEMHDAEIYAAVVNSMNEWQKRHQTNHLRVKRQQQNICYGDLGCFETTGPFSYLDTLPADPKEIATRFMLYPSHSKRKTGQSPGEFSFDNLTEAFHWSDAGFNSTLPTKVMIHGFGSDCTHIWVYEMRSALMAVEDANVICVDWSNGATLPNYVKATANTRLVGKQLARLLKGLTDRSAVSFRNMHLIGFSLGAHVAGFAGAEIGNISRITGLDPAGPLFESQDPRARLDQTDAAFVDVIHSNGENLILGGLGSWQPMGHVDFYPNGGRMQKGCTNLFVGAVSDIIWSSANEGRSLCNHRRAYKFFTDSVSPRCHFPAFPCNSYDDFLSGNCFPCSEERTCGNMGYYADRSKGRGQLYLITRDEEPFCAHQYQIKIESSPNDEPIVSYGNIKITLVGDSLLNETFTLNSKEDEEMILGSSISRIIVPHPILLEPENIEIVYNAYAGWLTSGLTHWAIDKITLTDSFGRSLSVCKKNLLLYSGVPVLLPLYPGECNLPKTFEGSNVELSKRIDEKQKILNFSAESDKIERPKLVRDAFDILNLPWNSDSNDIDGETEQSRAFNTRVIKATRKIPSPVKISDGRETSREVVEPILKPHYAVKIGRSHDPTRDKPEITEPILGPTTDKSTTTLPTPNETDWIPTVSSTTPKSKRDNSKREGKEGTFNYLVRTVQILPQRLARMFEEAEKYTKETILPLVSTYTPKFISDFILPKEQKYLPLSFEDSTEALAPQTTTKLMKERRSFDPPPIETIEKETETTTKLTTSTIHSNIQKIGKKKEKVVYIFPTEAETTTTLKPVDEEEKNVPKREVLYVDLPVFDDSKDKKYIPLAMDDAKAVKPQ